MWQIQSNSGKNTEINKQSNVKFWFNRKKHGAVSYLFSCTDLFLTLPTEKIQRTAYVMLTYIYDYV